MVGAGVVGLAVAAALRRRGASVVVLDKEDRVGAHASGRNSGVLHAGFYYAADSNKARFCRDGNAAWTAWCGERGVALRRCGKLVVARDAGEHAGLDELSRRAAANGVELIGVTEAEAAELEPRARTAGRALWSPTTASVDPRAVMQRLLADVCAAGVEVRLGQPFIGVDGHAARTPGGAVPFGTLVNAAGLYADRVAAAFGIGTRYRILPFKGLYLGIDAPDGAFRRHVYPVPDLRNPFLGVHLTVTAAGGAKLGPTAVPALWREQYGGLAGFDLRELVEVAWREAGLLWSADFDFRRLAWSEVRKQSRRALVADAGALIRGLDPAQCRTWLRPGIRAQLLDITSRRLVMDLVIERGERSVHVLNAVSPAFTCALPFAEHVADAVEGVRAESP